MTISLATESLESLIEELKRRNISFLVAYVDHNEFNKGPDQGIVWSCDSGGNLVLQSTLLRLLVRWFHQVEQQRTDPWRQT